MIAELPSERVASLNTALAARGISPVLIIEDAPLERQSQLRAVQEIALNALRHHALSKPVHVDVYFCLLEENSVNGRAIRHEDAYVIALSAGAFSTLRIYFHSSLLSIELKQAIGLAGGSSWGSEKFDHASALISWLAQDDRPEEANTSFLCASICLLFLVYHEYCHIISGHLDLLMPNGATFFSMDEAVSLQLIEDEALSRRTVEMDADAFGAIQANHYAGVSDMWSAFPGSTTEHQIRLVYVSIALLFLLFERKVSAPYRLRTHPPPGWRFEFAAGSFMEIICQENKRPYEDFVKDFTTPVINGVFDFINNRSVESAFLQDVIAWSQNGNQELQRILKRWALLLPKLEQKKLAPAYKLAPAQAEPA